MKKQKTDWKSLGYLLSVVINLFALVRDTFVKMGVGIELLPWDVGEGREGFVKEFLQPLGQKFLASQKPAKPRVRKSIIVDLSTPPKLPFDGATIEANAGGGKVKIEKRKDGELYVDGKKVILHLSERQQNGKVIQGHELREELTGKPVLHPNIMDALMEYPELFPESWKKDENGNIRYIFFWGAIFRDADGDLYVRYVYFGDGRWRVHDDWLNGGWRSSYPSALLAS